ncbi:hypothetical protein BDQ17DRAFT_1194522, partial [Cyathus striatus]
QFSILPVLTLDGIISHDIILGSVTSSLFLKFLNDHIPYTNPYSGPRSIIVVDNCNIHHSKEVRQLIEE